MKLRVDGHSLGQSRKVVVSKPVGRSLIAGIEQEIVIEIPVVTAH